LSKHPDKLSKLRDEHSEVFGTDLSAATDILKEHPQSINELPYTTATIKEVLRLFPPASGMRGGLPNVYLHDKYGNRFPTENLNVWVNHSALHRNPEYWPEPHSFIPERWLAKPGDPLYSPKGGWRPFEYGPRNCIGQTLAMLDIKITLVMTARRFDFKDKYAELDHSRPPRGISTVYGERAYQITQGAAHPADGLPCQVTLRGDSPLSR
jgi:cytochrome P450